MATPGVERMAERGKSSPLKEEIREAVRAGHAGAEIRGDTLRSPGSLGVDFRISRSIRCLSSMLAPSPTGSWGLGARPVRRRALGGRAHGRVVHLRRRH
jgi:hypothetical protein